MITITKDFDYYINLPLRTMGGSNMITAMDLDDDMRLGLYYLMQVYNLGFHHYVRADWEWISLSQGEDGKYLSGNEIIALPMDEEIFNKLKLDFERGIYPEGYKGNKNINKPPVEPEFAYTGKFGWLSPSGEFTVSDWGEHEGSAFDIIEEKGFEDDYDKWDGPYGDSDLRLARDYLCYEKGYVLIHNPSLSGGYEVTDIKPLTKKQKEFLYDYFMAVGLALRASHYIEE